MILSLGLFVASGFLLLFFLISYGKTRKESEEYIHIRQTYTAIREDIFPALAAPVEKQEPKQLPYITADYAGLRELNPDIVGWIAIPDTPISYPVMQAADNQLYLKRDSSGKKSSNGAVFLDANNSLSPLDQNTILYAHNMGQGRETEMFGPLLLYKEKEYLEAHPYISIRYPPGIARLVGSVCCAASEFAGQRLQLSSSDLLGSAGIFSLARSSKGIIPIRNRRICLRNRYYPDAIHLRPLGIWKQRSFCTNGRP